MRQHIINESLRSEQSIPMNQTEFLGHTESEATQAKYVPSVEKIWNKQKGLGLPLLKMPVPQVEF